MHHPDTESPPALLHKYAEFDSTDPLSGVCVCVSSWNHLIHDSETHLVICGSSCTAAAAGESRSEVSRLDINERCWMDF